MSEADSGIVTDPVLALIRAKVEGPASGERMTVRKAKRSRLTVNEIRQAITANPGHRIAKVYAAATAGLPDSQVVFVDAADMQALLNNSEVKTTEEVVRGARVVTKHMQ